MKRPFLQVDYVLLTFHQLLLAEAGGAARPTDIREVFNPVFYILRAERAWRLLLYDFTVLENHLSLLARAAHNRVVGTGKCEKFNLSD